MIDPEMIGKQLGAIVREAVGPLLKRIEELESRQPLHGQPGKDGVNGSDGKDGQNGIGEKGLDGAPGRDGKDGKDGQTPQIDYADIVKAVEETHERLVAKYVLDLERRGSDAISRALDKIAQPKDGRDGVNGKDGRDGLSVESLQREYDPATHEIRELWKANGMEKELRYPAGGIRPAGYWRTGGKAKAGEAWTDKSALWIALKDTSEAPGTLSKDWVLGARAGRDGKDGKDGRSATVALSA